MEFSICFVIIFFESFPKTSIFNLKYIICKSPVLTDYVKKQIIDFCDLIDIFGQLVFHNFF